MWTNLETWPRVSPLPSHLHSHILIPTWVKIYQEHEGSSRVHWKRVGLQGQSFFEELGRIFGASSSITHKPVEEASGQLKHSTKWKWGSQALKEACKIQRQQTKSHWSLFRIGSSNQGLQPSGIRMLISVHSFWAYQRIKRYTSDPSFVE